MKNHTNRNRKKTGREIIFITNRNFLSRTIVSFVCGQCSPSVRSSSATSTDCAIKKKPLLTYNNFFHCPQRLKTSHCAAFPALGSSGSAKDLRARPSFPHTDYYFHHCIYLYVISNNFSHSFHCIYTQKRILKAPPNYSLINLLNAR